MRWTWALELWKSFCISATFPAPSAVMLRDLLGLFQAPVGGFMMAAVWIDPQRDGREVPILLKSIPTCIYTTNITYYEYLLRGGRDIYSGS